jgi:hypothetical protein
MIILMLVCEGADSGWVCARAQLGAEGAGVHHVLVWSTPLGRTRWLVAVFAGVGAVHQLAFRRENDRTTTDKSLTTFTAQTYNTRARSRAGARVIAGPKEDSSKYDSLRFGDYHYAKKGGFLWYRSGQIRIFIILAEPSGDKPRPRGSRMRARDRALKRRWLESLHVRIAQAADDVHGGLVEVLCEDGLLERRVEGAEGGCPVVAAVAKAENRSLSTIRSAVLSALPAAEDVGSDAAHIKLAIEAPSMIQKYRSPVPNRCRNSRKPWDSLHNGREFNGACHPWSISPLANRLARVEMSTSATNAARERTAPGGAPIFTAASSQSSEAVAELIGSLTKRASAAARKLSVSWVRMTVVTSVLESPALSKPCMLGVKLVLSIRSAAPESGARRWGSEK